MVTITKGDQCMRLRAHAAHIHAIEQRINNRRGQAWTSISRYAPSTFLMPRPAGMDCRCRIPSACLARRQTRVRLMLNRLF
jgi:hypothetical protein